MIGKHDTIRFVCEDLGGGQLLSQLALVASLDLLILK